MTLSRITAILYSPDKKDGADIYIDDQPVMTVSADTIIEAGLHTGMQIDESKLYEIERTVTLVKAKNKAYNYLSYGDMSAKRLKEKLLRAGFSEDVCDMCVGSMREKGYIDDARYAAALARNMAQNKLYGPRRIVSELCVKGVERELAENAASELETDFEQNIRRLISGKFNRERNKQIAALLRYGYDYDMISSILGGDYE